ncbi:MAG: DUF423 domain-containing protein [Proteobacteria bacterium]|nr:DUF423 domain-containing protein [Pseudomonadota bacterium]
MPRFQLVLAGLMGAAGVILLALAAHAGAGAGLDSAGNLLLLHAIAVVAASSDQVEQKLWHPAATLATSGWQVGSILFAADIAMRAFAGNRLFPFAAPTGGTILIASWLVFAIAAIVGRR